MAIKASFSAGETTVSVGGLFQWDYGQVLEIECADINFEIMEVHFACPGMTVALPRPCTFVNGVGTVPIPDQCLEQEDTITAWLCRIDDTQSHTIKTIIFPITKRTKPIRTREIPTELVDRYTELISEVGETIDALKTGNITAAKATLAETANRANTAKNAENASHAISAGNAENANFAVKAGEVNMALIDTCTVSKGASTSTLVELNTPYFVVCKLKHGSTTEVFSGMMTLTGEYANYYHILSLDDDISLKIIYGTSGSGVSIRDSVDNIDTDYSGTVYFYKFGSLVESEAI